MTPCHRRKRAKRNMSIEQQLGLEIEVQILSLKVKLLSEQLQTLRTYIDDKNRLPMAPNSKKQMVYFDVNYLKSRGCIF